jgi:uncharacterized delta-60 repeat protein
MKTTRSLFFSLAASIMLLAAGSQAAFGAPTPPSAGSLDPSFGSSGVVLTSIGNDYYAIGEAVALQGDGKIVVAGYAYNNGYDFAVARYTPAGTLDTSFGNSGKVGMPNGGTVLTPAGGGAFGQSVAIQPDGKIIVAGGINDNFGLVRYTTSGNLDTTFGNGGIVSTPIDSESYGYSVAVQSDGKIVVAGGTYLGYYDFYEFAVVRYTASGALDTTFGMGGIVVTNVGDDYYSFGQGVVVQSDGKIVVAGYTYNGGYEFAVVRYTPSGALDAGFGTGGIALTSLGNDADAYGTCVALQSDGKIVVGGGVELYDDSVALPPNSNIAPASKPNSGTIEDFALVRYTTAGVPDTTFGTGGAVLTTVGNGDYGYGQSVKVQSDGKIVLAGGAYNGTYTFGVSRYTPAGALDSSFGSGGIVITLIGSESYGEGVALQSDGKIVVAGYASSSGDEFAVARYLGAPMSTILNQSPGPK